MEKLIEDSKPIVLAKKKHVEASHVRKIDATEVIMVVRKTICFIALWQAEKPAFCVYRLKIVTTGDHNAEV